MIWNNILFFVVKINELLFIEYIVTNHSFILGNIQNQANIIATIPPANLVDFNRGLVL